MKKWVCSVCGYVHEGDTPPEFCPVCKVPAEKFVEQAGEMTWAAEHVVGVGKVFGADVPEEVQKEIIEGLIDALQLNLPVFCFPGNSELFYFLRLPACSSILRGIRCGPDPMEQPKLTLTNGTHPLYSSVPVCATDRNFYELHCARHEVLGWPLFLLESSSLDAHEHRNRKQDICCRRRALCFYH